MWVPVQVAAGVRFSAQLSMGGCGSTYSAAKAAAPAAANVVVDQPSSDAPEEPTSVIKDETQVTQGLCVTTLHRGNLNYEAASCGLIAS